MELSAYFKMQINIMHGGGGGPNVGVEIRWDTGGLISYLSAWGLTDVFA